jgi:NADPH2:quinone reductase
MVDRWCSIFTIGLTENHELHTTVMPFIIRGVILLDISSAMTPCPLYKGNPARLGTNLKPCHLT